MSLLAEFGRVAAGLAMAVAAGAAVSGAFTGGLTRREKAAWSLATGLLLQALALLALLAIGATPRAPSLLLIEAITAIAAVFLRRRSGPNPPAARNRHGSEAIVFGLAALAAAAWLVFLVSAIADGMWATDFLAIWGYKGKVIFLTSTIPAGLFEDPALAFTNPSYPLLVPLTLAGLAAFSGQWNDQALALLYPACALVTLFALSGFLERRVSRLAGVTAAALTALCFFLYRPANAGTAEIPLALGLVLVCGAAGDALSGTGKAQIVRLGVAAFFCAALKQEGTLFALILAAVMLTFPRESPARSRRMAATALLLPLALHWAALYLLRGNPGHPEFDFTLLEPRRWVELPALFVLVFGRLLRTEALGSAVALLAVAAYLLATRKGILDPLLLVFGFQLLGYAVIPMFSFHPLWAIDSAFSRIVMTLFPAFTLVLASRSGVLTVDRAASRAIRQTPRRT